MWVAVALLGAAPVFGAGDWTIGLRGGPSIPRLRGGGNEVSKGYSSIVAPNSGLIASTRKPMRSDSRKRGTSSAFAGAFSQ